MLGFDKKSALVIHIFVHNIGPGSDSLLLAGEFVVLLGQLFRED